MSRADFLCSACLLHPGVALHGEPACLTSSLQISYAFGCACLIWSLMHVLSGQVARGHVVVVQGGQVARGHVVVVQAHPVLFYAV